MKLVQKIIYIMVCIGIVYNPARAPEYEAMPSRQEFEAEEQQFAQQKMEEKKQAEQLHKEQQQRYEQEQARAAQAQAQEQMSVSKKITEAKKSLEPSKKYLQNVNEEDLRKQLKDFFDEQYNPTKYTEAVQDAFPQIRSTLEELNNLQEYKTPSTIRSNYQTTFARNVANMLLDTLVMVFDFIGLDKLRITALKNEKQKLENQLNDLSPKLNQGNNIKKYSNIAGRIGDINQSLATLQTNNDYKSYIENRGNFYKTLDKAQAVARKTGFMSEWSTFNWQKFPTEDIKKYIDWRNAASKSTPKREFSDAVDAVIKARQNLRDAENKLIDSYTKNLNSYTSSADKDFRKIVDEESKTKIPSQQPKDIILSLDRRQQAADLKTELTRLIEDINKNITEQAAYEWGIGKYRFTESPYEILDLKKNATTKEIDDAYKMYADIFSQSKELTKYQNAYAVLSDPVLRQKVDRYENYLKQHLTDLTNEYDQEHLSSRLLKLLQDKTTETLQRLYTSSAETAALSISHSILKELRDDAQRKEQSAKEFGSWSKK